MKYLIAGIGGAVILIVLALAVPGRAGQPAPVAVATSAPTPSGDGVVRGLIVDAEGPGISVVERIRLVDDAGVEWSFAIAPSVATDREHPNSGNHLRGHVTYKWPAVVHYQRNADGSLTATRVLDGN